MYLTEKKIIKIKRQTLFSSDLVTWLYLSKPRSQKIKIKNQQSSCNVLITRHGDDASLTLRQNAK